jgi:acyl-CoA thioester hydrolase
LAHRDRVRYGDLDAMGHLGNVDFLRFFESARVAYVAELLPDLRADQPAVSPVIVASCHIDYRGPAYLGDEIVTQVWPDHLSTHSLKVAFEMRNGADDLLAEGYAVLVGYDYVARKVADLPQALRDAATGG